MNTPSMTGILVLADTDRYLMQLGRYCDDATRPVAANVNPAMPYLIPSPHDIDKILSLILSSRAFCDDDNDDDDDDDGDDNDDDDDGDDDAMTASTDDIITTTTR